MCIRDRDNGDINSSDQRTQTQWQIHTLTIQNEDAILDWDQEVWTQSVMAFEELFNQDLNGDESIGFDTSKLTATETDTAGLRLYKDSDGALYIKKEDNKFLSITNEWGGTESFDFSSMDEDENYGESAKAYAITKLTENDKTVYKIAIKYTMKTSLNGEITENSMWEVLSASEEGVINFEESSWGSISPWEERFGQDMNGDGSTGFNLSSLSLLDTDSQGAIVKIDQDNGVYVFDSIDSNEYYTVQDKWGGTPSFDHQATWEDGTLSLIHI